MERALKALCALIIAIVVVVLFTACFMYFDRLVYTIKMYVHGANDTWIGDIAYQAIESGFELIYMTFLLLALASAISIAVVFIEWIAES